MVERHENLEPVKNSQSPPHSPVTAHPSSFATPESDLTASFPTKDLKPTSRFVDRAAPSNHGGEVHQYRKDRMSRIELGDHSSLSHSVRQRGTEHNDLLSFTCTLIVKSQQLASDEVIRG